MMKAKIELTDTLYTIITTYPQTREVFVANGFPQFADDAQLQGMGKMLTFKAAMLAKKKNPEIFLSLLDEVIEQHAMMAEDGVQAPAVRKSACSIAGILPCPVKIPLLDGFGEFLKGYEQERGKTISYRLKSASGGLGWLEEEIRDAKGPEDLPDLVISAGFELFFDRERYGAFRDEGMFKDLSSLPEFNRSFDGLELKDPKENYSIVGAVPAIFLVDTLELKGRNLPRTWDDILSEEFAGSISLPVEDFDLFNAVCLTLYRERGIEAIKALGRNMLSSMHPAQMVKNRRNEEKPAVTVLPWFFTRMIFGNTSLQVVWPEDGSILSPIFVAAKEEKAEELAPVVEFFESEAVGKIFMERGFFPSVNPQVDNTISADQKLQWLGWDFIYDHDLSALIRECTEAFEGAQA